MKQELLEYLDAYKNKILEIYQSADITRYIDLFNMNLTQLTKASALDPDMQDMLYRHIKILNDFKSQAMSGQRDVNTFMTKKNQKLICFDQFALIFEELNPTIQQLFNTKKTIKVSESDINELRRNNYKAIWHLQVNCYLDEFQESGNLIRVPIAYLIEKRLLPIEITLVDENNRIVTIDDLKIKALMKIKNLKSDSKKNQAKLVFEYFRPLYGVPKGYDINRWPNDTETSYKAQISKDIRIINQYIPFPATVQASSNGQNLFHKLKASTEYSIYFYLLKLYTLWKFKQSIAIGSNTLSISKINETTYENTMVNAIENKTRSPLNFKNIVVLLYNNSTAYNEALGDTISLSSQVAPLSGNGQLFDEFFTLLMLNLPLLIENIIVNTFVWRSRMWNDTLTLQFLTDAPLKIMCSHFQRDWFRRQIALTEAKKGNKNPSVYLIGKTLQLQANKYTYLVNYTKEFVINILRSHTFPMEKDIMDLLESIKASPQIYLTLLSSLTKKKQIANTSVFKDLIEQEHEQNTLNLLNKVPALLQFLYNKATATSIDANQFNSVLNNTAPFLVNYTESYPHTKQSITIYIYTCIIAIYIVTKLLPADDAIPHLNLRRKGLRKIDTDKNIEKIKTLMHLFNGKKSMPYFKLLYATKDISDDLDSITLSPNFMLTNILDLPSQKYKYELSGSIQSNSIHFSRSLIAFFIIIFLRPLYCFSGSADSQLTPILTTRQLDYLTNNNNNNSFAFDDTTYLLERYI